MKELRSRHLVIMASQSEKDAYQRAWVEEEFDSMSSWIREVLKDRIKNKGKKG